MKCTSASKSENEFVKTVKSRINFLILSLVLLAASSRCFAEMSVEIVSKERAKKLGLEFRLKEAGSEAVTVELAFKAEGELKSFFCAELAFRDGAKVLVSSSLREERPGLGHIVVSFSADHTILDKLTLRVVVSEPRLGGDGYDLRVKDFVEPKKSFHG